MHHIAHDRSRADQTDSDDQIEETGRLQAGQGVHLRPALTLKHAKGFGLSDHLIDTRVFKGDAVRVNAGAFHHFADCG